ncbi:MAG TPA: hypothetical protein VJX29_12780 [Candidatus Acidoferrales bacterium]|nr:hypothetical protein [Candidatus Acidoferrales bacterium]
MRRAAIHGLLLAACLGAPVLSAQVVVDRVVARIENDIITLSDVRELAAYQRLSGRRPAPEPELLQQLIDQWIVANDAAAARFPAAPAQQVDAQLAALQNQVGTPQQFAARLRELDLSEQDVRRLVAKQIFLDLYLERRFRAVARVQPADVEQYYRNEFVPQLQRRKQAVPLLDDVRDSITDLLLERDITRLAQQWIEQTRASLDVEIFPESRP